MGAKRSTEENVQKQETNNEVLNDASKDAPQEAPETENASGKRKRQISQSDKLKFAGLIAFIVILIVITALAWPYISDVFSEGGVDRLVDRVQSAGAFGVVILLGMQLLQIIVAFIPGEVVQMAAGLIYGPWLGALVIILGCIMSSAIVYKLVDTLGAPFVKDMVSTEHLEKFEKFQKTGRLDIVVFILFLIPAMPKDTFTYLVPLTDMPMSRFLILSNLGRFPAVLASTFMASDLAKGDYKASIIIAVVLGLIALLAIVFRDRIMNGFGGSASKTPDKKPSK